MSPGTNIYEGIQNLDGSSQKLFNKMNKGRTKRK